MRQSMALATIVLLASANAAGATAVLVPIGPSGTFAPGIAAISADGTTAVGFDIRQAARWTQADGVQGLGDLPGGGSVSFARDVSADGSVVVGRGTSLFGTEAFRWTNAGMVGLGDLPGGSFGSEANAVSQDGATLVGSGQGASGREAFRWTSAGGMVGLGDLPGGSFDSRGVDVSADGTVVVGESHTDEGGQVFRWTAATGMADLGDLDPTLAFPHSWAGAVSADGATVVGYGAINGGIEAFRWTSADGMEGLGHLAGVSALDSRAVAVSADGSIIVGTGGLSADSYSFFWTEADGMRSLEDVLVNDYGLDLGGWTLGWVSDMSPDGRALVGEGLDPDGFNAQWLVLLPEPAAAPLLLAAAAALTARARSRGRLPGTFIEKLRSWSGGYRRPDRLCNFSTSQ